MLRGTNATPAFLFLLAAHGLMGCDRSPREPEPTKDPSASESRTPAGRLEWINAHAGEDLPQAVRRELARARKDGRDLLVYVGASWCEPCERFHHAAEKGELDTIFPRLRVLAFDHDRDADRLGAAGYVSQLIPLFVVPNEDGTASNRRIEGSVKGEAAIGNIAGRLRQLLPRPTEGPKG